MSQPYHYLQRAVTQRLNYFVLQQSLCIPVNEDSPARRAAATSAAPAPPFAVADTGDECVQLCLGCARCGSSVRVSQADLRDERYGGGGLILCDYHLTRALEPACAD